MPDALEILRSPLVPTEPDVRFAERLRARIERALALPIGVNVSHLAIDDAAGTSRPDDRRRDDHRPAHAPGPPSGPQRLTAYLAVADGRAAIDWYRSAFGASLVGEPIVMPGGSLGHAELDFAGSRLFLSEGSAEQHVEPPRPGAGATTSLVLEVDDVDAAVERALAEGAELERPAADYPHGRNAVVRDPFAHRWMLSGVGAHVREGDVVYVSLAVADLGRAARFYADVLGWEFGPEPEPGHARQVTGLSFPLGVRHDADHVGLGVCFAVDDLAGALERVRDAGGSVLEVMDDERGRRASISDDQGDGYWLWQDDPGDPTRRSPVNGAVAGDISYLTFGVADTARTRVFLATVLGLRFEPGSVPDGWGVVDTAPMAGLHGGEDGLVVRPMYRVDDLAGAVRGSGRTAARRPTPCKRPTAGSRRAATTRACPSTSASTEPRPPATSGGARRGCAPAAGGVSRRRPRRRPTG